MVRKARSGDNPACQNLKRTSQQQSKEDVNQDLKDHDNPPSKNKGFGRMFTLSPKRVRSRLPRPAKSNETPTNMPSNLIFLLAYPASALDGRPETGTRTRTVRRKTPLNRLTASLRGIGRCAGINRRSQGERGLGPLSRPATQHRGKTSMRCCVFPRSMNPIYGQIQNLSTVFLPCDSICHIGNF